jgi:heme A synthase
MNEFFHRVLTRPRYFVGFMIFLILVILFFWRLIDLQGFTESIQGFMNDMWVMFKYALTLAIMVMGIMVLFGWRPFKGKKSGH